MKTRERIGLERENTDAIIIHVDGSLFCNLYERSAYAFHTRIRPFKVHVRTLKGEKQPYVWMGIPKAKVTEYLNGRDTSTGNDGTLKARLAQPIDENAYTSWKEHIVTEHIDEKKRRGTQAESNQEPQLARYMKVIDEIKGLNLASTTPMEALNNLDRLKRMVDGN